MSYSHAPEDYACPFCRVGRGDFGDKIWVESEHVVIRTNHVTAFVASHWWPNNPGHCLVIPNDHYENIYELPSAAAEQIHAAAREIAIAMKVGYGCHGTSTRQHNEPAGYQEVWHYHLHVFPRWIDDRLYELTRQRSLAPPDERLERAAMLRQSLGVYPPVPWPPRKPVCVGGVVIRDNKALFVRQAKGHVLEGMWTIPWGFAEQDDKPEEACLREVLEEAGVTAKVEGLIGVQNLRRPEDAFGLIFLCSHESGELRPDDVETERRALHGIQTVLAPTSENPRGLPGFW